MTDGSTPGFPGTRSGNGRSAPQRRSPAGPSAAHRFKPVQSHPQAGAEKPSLPPQTQPPKQPSRTLPAERKAPSFPSPLSPQQGTPKRAAPLPPLPKRSESPIPKRSDRLREETVTRTRSSKPTQNHPPEEPPTQTSRPNAQTSTQLSTPVPLASRAAQVDQPVSTPIANTRLTSRNMPSGQKAFSPPAAMPGVWGAQSEPPPDDLPPDDVLPDELLEDDEIKGKSWGLIIAIVVGVLVLVGAAIAAFFLWPSANNDSGVVTVPFSGKEISELYELCDANDMLACDQLYLESDPGSKEEKFGDTCGNTRTTSGYCHLPEVVPDDVSQSETGLDKAPENDGGQSTS